MKLLLSIFLMFILVSSVTFTNFAFAYEKENHYWLKIALALNCGFTLDEARLIGIGDFSIDEDPDTQPVRSGSGKDNAKWKWHALPTENPDVDKNEVSKGNQEIKQRQHELYDHAMNEKDTPMKLFKFGQYLHYQEDKWSHWGYTTGMGHAVPNVVPGMDSPDETHANPEHYRYMVFDSMVNLGKLAKSLGKDTECVSDLVPLDTYKSAPEYGKDFPWFSPQEIKRSKDALKFQKDVEKHLSDWGKTALIDEVITASDKNGDEGVTDSFVAYIAKKTGTSKSDITKKYDYTHIDIDESGNAKKIPNNLIKSATPKETGKTAKKDDGSKTAQLKNEIKEMYQISKIGEKVTSILKKANDAEAKSLKKLSGDVKSIYAKTKNSDAKKLGEKIQAQIKDAESDKKQISAIDSQSKKVTKQILVIAKDNKITKAELDKTTKEGKTGTSKNQKPKESSNKPIDHGTIVTPLDLQLAADRLAEILSDEKSSDKQNAEEINKFIQDYKKLLEDAKQKTEAKQTDSDAPPESILDDVETDSGPDARAPKEKPSDAKPTFDWAKIAEEDMKIIEEANKKLEDQLKDRKLWIDFNDGADALRIELRLQDSKKVVIDKDSTVISDTKSKKPESTTPEKTEKTIIQKDPIITEPKPSNTKPTLSIPKQVTQEATGPSGANVAFSTSSQDKEDGSLTPTCNPQSGSTFPIGATTVSCIVTDSNNNSISGSFTVTVRDTTPPAFAPFQPTEGVRDDTGVQVFFDVTANDLVDGNVPVSCNYQSGYKFPPGVTELKCSASDSRGNQSTKTVQITVTITESGQ